MAEIKYGHREGSGHLKEYPCAADQYFYRRGGRFVKMSAGNVTLCASPDALVAGWAEVPKDSRADRDMWKSSSTAAKDKVFVIDGIDDIYELPVDESIASLAVTLVGKSAGIVTANATYTLVQKAYLGWGTASPLTIVDVDLVNKTALVKINPSNKQAV